MNADLAQSFLSQAGTCARAMLENSAYIEGELPNVELPSGLDAKARQVCSNLVAAKHDVIHEISEIDDLLKPSSQDDAAICARIRRIVDWLSEPILEMDELVQGLQSASQNDPRYGLAFMLTAESATNIMNTFQSTVDAADAVENDVKPTA